MPLPHSVYKFMKLVLFHGARVGLTKKAEPPPTCDVNRDSGTDSANGGWLRRLVRRLAHRLRTYARTFKSKHRKVSVLTSRNMKTVRTCQRFNRNRWRICPKLPHQNKDLDVKTNNLDGRRLIWRAKRLISAGGALIPRRSRFLSSDLAWADHAVSRICSWNSTIQRMISIVVACA